MTSGETLSDQAIELGDASTDSRHVFSIYGDRGLSALVWGDPIHRPLRNWLFRDSAFGIATTVKPDETTDVG